MRSFIAALVLVCVATAQVAAGPDSLSLKKGDRVRIKGVGQEGIFVVEDFQPEFLMVRDPDGIMPAKVRIADLSSLAVGVPNSPGQGASHGAILGALVGLASGMIVGFAMGDDPPTEFFAVKAEGKALFFGIAFSAGGMVIGAVAGSIHPGERWESIPLNARVGAGMAKNGTARLGIVFSIAGLVGE